MNKNTQLKKEMLLEGLVKSLGIITNACAIANVSRTSYYSYHKDAVMFAKEVDDISNIALDFAESQLFDLIKDKNITAIIFYLKTKGRCRGYSERIEYENIDPKNSNLIVEFVNSNGSKI